MSALAENKKAYFNYEILETFEAGLVLEGHEVKSIKSGKSGIQGAYAIIRGREAYVLGMHVPPYQVANTPTDYDPDRTRKLLLTKKEIAYLAGKTAQKGLTLVPLKVYTDHGLCKLSLGLGKGKKNTDKRQTIKTRENRRSLDRTLKGDA
ncbi:MAG: SsrA-binding protein [Candidatus Ryanbacteria bacterium RIFCSPHIGHO2_02_FULL_45_13b]|uniref:SsrA-binding protein n=1 Tax=Candidatus Ryanbacteria bacterium RIFCSPHIGHO2_02_FULL_45_13b TaxID=1802117 RepID=A0A1G2GB31_9BACT|nr:MAG: SsrA-binding protein [Candidatus Ryanbacteria bacterium RIFCSPHIGHO2_02_FULL_45_13b]